MAKMNPNAKALWVEALRSGKYQQTSGKLRKSLPSGEAYCCLGVLCVVAQENGVEVPDDVLRYDAFLINPVKQWAGLEAQDPTLTDGEAELQASVWNDQKHKSFAEIADMIERSL